MGTAVTVSQSQAEGTGATIKLQEEYRKKTLSQSTQKVFLLQKKCKFKESLLSILPGKDSFLENKYQGVPHRHADFEQGLERNTYFGEKNTVACQTLGAYELIFLRSIWPFIFNTVVSTAGKPECFKIT